MNKDAQATTVEYGASHGTLTSYTVGLIFSLLLTVAAYLLVVHQGQSHVLVIGEIIALAFIQLLVQLIFFLHLNKESNPRWNLAVFLFAVGTVAIIVVGSLWIMRNLNYHMMTPEEINSSLTTQDDL